MSDNPPSAPTIPEGVLASVGCVALSIAVGACLHAAPDRPAAAWVVPLLWTWGALALLAAWRTGRTGVLPLGTATLLAITVAVRAPLVGVPLLLSDDVYRFLWEGKVLSHGLNPFLLAPDTIPGLDDALRARVNHPSIPSIYPPFALAWFRLLDLLGLGPIGAQALGLVCDLGAVWAIRRFLADRGRPLWPALLFALHPLAAVEGTAGAHLETPAIFLALLGLAVGPGAVRSFFTTASAGFKLVPLFWLPATLTDRRSVAGATAAIVLAILSVLPILSAGPALFTAWHRYTTEWQFNGFLFPWLYAILGDHARLVLLLLAIPAAVHALRARDPDIAWLRIGTAFVLLSPTVHPWYVLWAVVPSLLLARWEWPIAAVFLQGSYLVLTTLRPDGRWDEGPWLWACTWAPAISAVLAWRRWSGSVISGKVPRGGTG